jgi:hypothetical protein
MEELINKVVAAVLAELARRGVKVDFGPPQKSSFTTAPMPGSATHVVDMSEFRSPVLLERHLMSLAPEVKEIAVPAGTVITPGAKDLLRRKKLILKSNPTTN